MTTMKHTPGPWRFASHFIESDAGQTVVECYRAMTVDNARLIAAAPDLLEALRKCETELGIRQDFVPLGPALTLAPVIRAAIAKATGEK